MKNSGIIRRIDDLGRVVIPKEIRRILKIHEGDPFELFIEEDGVLFKKYNPYIDRKKEASAAINAGKSALTRNRINAEIKLFDSYGSELFGREMMNQDLNMIRLDYLESPENRESKPMEYHDKNGNTLMVSIRAKDNEVIALLVISYEDIKNTHTVRVLIDSIASNLKFLFVED